MAAAHLCAVLAGYASAQRDSARTESRLVVSGGINQNDRIDLTASPLKYDGRGFDLAVDYDRCIGSYALAASVEGGTVDLSSLSGPPVSTERLTEGDVELAIERAIGSTRSATRRFAVGLALDADVAVTATGYADPDTTVSNYLLALGSLGPSVAWALPLLGGTAAMRLTTPVIALVDHPYSDIKDQNAGADFRLVSLSSFRGLSGTISYAPVQGQRFGLTSAYRLDLFRYDDVQPVRAVSQRLTIGLVTRFGAPAR
jgi:hypothetical protein